jgi:hypothetical protein
MRGNIDASLNIDTGDSKIVIASGWIEFQDNDPGSVQVWVGVGQGKNATNGVAVYGKGWCTVNRPAPGNSQRTTWQCNVRTTDGAGYKNGNGDAGAVVIATGIQPYPWGRDVSLKKN